MYQSVTLIFLYNFVWCLSRTVKHTHKKRRSGDENSWFFGDFLWIHKLGFYIWSNGCVRKLPSTWTVLVADCTLLKIKKKVALVTGNHWITTLIFLVKTETPPPRRWWCGRRGGPRALGFEIWKIESACNRALVRRFVNRNWLQTEIFWKMNGFFNCEGFHDVSLQLFFQAC